jgi:hypothetical protein
MVLATLGGCDIDPSIPSTGNIADLMSTHEGVIQRKLLAFLIHGTIQDDERCRRVE